MISIIYKMFRTPCDFYWSHNNTGVNVASTVSLLNSYVYTLAYDQRISFAIAAKAGNKQSATQVACVNLLKI